jgi:hypothetical protein
MRDVRSDAGDYLRVADCLSKPVSHVNTQKPIESAGKDAVDSKE